MHTDQETYKVNKSHLLEYDLYGLKIQNIYSTTNAFHYIACESTNGDSPCSANRMACRKGQWINCASIIYQAIGFRLRAGLVISSDSGESFGILQTCPFELRKWNEFVNFISYYHAWNMRHKAHPRKLGWMNLYDSYKQNNSDRVIIYWFIKTSAFLSL